MVDLGRVGIELDRCSRQASCLLEEIAGGKNDFEVKDLGEGVVGVGWAGVVRWVCVKEQGSCFCSLSDVCAECWLLAEIKGDDQGIYEFCSCLW